MIVAYVFTGGDLDFSIKNLFFGTLESSDMWIYLLTTGFYIVLITTALSFIIKQHNIKSTLVKMFSPDKYGVTIIVLVSALCFEILVGARLTQNNWLFIFISFLVGFLILLLGPYFFRKMIMSKAKSLSEMKISQKINQIELNEFISDNIFRVI